MSISVEELIEEFFAFCEEKREMIRGQIVRLHQTNGVRVFSEGVEVTAEAIAEQRNALAEFESVIAKVEAFRRER
jgi:hypothetical protein